MAEARQSVGDVERFKALQRHDAATPLHDEAGGSWSDQPETPLLVSPTVRQPSGQRGNGQTVRQAALDNRGDDPRRHESQWRQKPDTPFNLAFLLGDVGERYGPA